MHTNSERPNNTTNYFYFLIGLSHLEIICNAVKGEAREKCGKETLLAIQAHAVDELPLHNILK